MAAFETHAEFAKVSRRRLRDARELLDAPTVDAHEAGARHRHARAAYYLAGYAVECGYKSRIIELECDLSRPALATLTAASERLRSRGVEVPNLLAAAGHNLDTLSRLTDLDARAGNDLELRRAFGTARKWDPRMRYDPSAPELNFVDDYLTAVDKVLALLSSLRGVV